MKDQSLTAVVPTKPRRAIRNTIRHHRISMALAALVFISAVFWLFPGLDIAASRFFYNPAAGFDFSGNAALRLVRRIGIDLTWAYDALAVTLLAAGLAIRSPLWWRKGLFMVCVMAIGPGLIVNAILKDHWGRARPRSIIEFGGTLPFSKVWEVVPYCQSNCSFVSGEASASFALLAMLFVIPGRYRKVVALPLAGIISLVSFNRILFGGHFLSDTLLSWAIVAVVMLVCERLLLQRDLRVPQ